ncbi:MAG: alanyl-tRNA editing protein [Alphaproteobacteria bacterium]
MTETLSLFRDDAYLQTCTAEIIDVRDHGILLDKTIFYPTGGGQPGDTGYLLLGDGRRLTITDTIKGPALGEILHIIDSQEQPPPAGTPVTAFLDWERRYKHMKMHTALHLLSAVLPFPVTGGQVGMDRSRLDFDIPEMSVTKEEITEKLCALIEGDHSVDATFITDDELARRPELIKTMSVKPPTGAGTVRLIKVQDLDLQPCGGTHVRRTGEIGPIEVIKIEKKGRQNRRVVLGFSTTV